MSSLTEAKWRARWSAFSDSQTRQQISWNRIDVINAFPCDTSRPKICVLKMVNNIMSQLLCISGVKNADYLLQYSKNTETIS